MILLAAGVAGAQNYVVINSQTILKSIDEYNAAVNRIDSLATVYQGNIDKAYEEVESMYNKYMQQKNTLDAATQRKREDDIINSEKRIAEYQEATFGSEGTLAKLQTESLEPMQKKVFETIGNYARENKLGLILDIATNPLVVYYDPALDHTQKIINLLK